MVNLFRRTQPIATKITDRLLIGLAYVPVLCLWLYGYFGLGMPWWDFAIALVIFGLLKRLHHGIVLLGHAISLGHAILVGVFVGGVILGVVVGCLIVLSFDNVILGVVVGCLIVVSFGVIILFVTQEGKIYCDIGRILGGILWVSGILGSFLFTLISALYDICGSRFHDLYVSHSFISLFVLGVGSVVFVGGMVGCISFFAVGLFGGIGIGIARFVLLIDKIAYKNNCFCDDLLSYVVCFFPYSRLWLLWILEWLLPQAEISRFLPMFAYTIAFFSPFLWFPIFLPIYRSPK